MPHITHAQVPHSDLIQLAQVGLYRGNVIAFFHWANDRVYIQECFSNGEKFWTTNQDDSILSTLERRGLMENMQITNAVIVDGQTGPRAAPPEFIRQNWSAFIARREALSFDIELEYRDPLYPSAEEEEETPPLEYIPAADLFGF